MHIVYQCYRKSIHDTREGLLMDQNSTPTAPTPTPRPRRDWFAFDRSDRWGMGILLGLVVVITVATSIVLPILRWADGDGIPLPFLSGVTVPELDAVGTSYGVAAYDVTLADPTVAQRLLDLAPGLLIVGLMTAGSLLIVAVMRTIAAGDPFVAANVRRMRQLAAVLLVGPFFTLFLSMSVHGALLSDVDLGGLALLAVLDIPWAYLVAGMVVALLAEAFKAGSRLRDDVEGLV
ncbi:hypothetical protein GCM10023153_32070 [Ornithinibacter aureus]|uniref:DUF2975 domain-containing protein n=2 Tax=Ornithinibacter aureus TaxID=622664 RepID=A0ABP8KAD0_9MICO